MSIKADKQAEGIAIENLTKSAPELNGGTAKKRGNSLVRRIVITLIASEFLLLIGALLVVLLYVKTHQPIYAGLGGLVLLIMVNVFAIRSIRRKLSPLPDLTESAWNISPPEWNFHPQLAENIPSEVSSVVDAIQAALARIKMSVRRQRDFTSDTAHELKTSVAVLKSSIQSSLQRPRTQREYQIGLEQLLEDCLRMEALLEKMLRLAQIEQASEDGAPRNAALTDVKSTCETALDRVRKMAEERGVTVELEASESIVLRADPDNLELVWMNLLENAVRHSVHGQTVKMRVVKSPPLMAQISVLDSGPGFAAVELPYIFQRFRRGVPNAGLSTDGFGLGLAICKAVVDSYGGTIEAINLPECGAELRVELPISQIL